MRSHQTRSACFPSSCQRSPGVSLLPVTTWNKNIILNLNFNFVHMQPSLLIPILLTPTLLTPSLLTPTLLLFTHSLTNPLPSHPHTCPSLLQVLQSVSELGPASWHRDPPNLSFSVFSANCCFRLAKRYPPLGAVKCHRYDVHVMGQMSH